MDTRGFRACAAATGVAQMPQVELPGGGWLTDSVRIIDHFEDSVQAPSLTPDDAAARFAAELVEAYADEWLWRPALYFRWAFAADAQLMSLRLAQGMLRDVPLPLALRRRLILSRQRRTYLRGDGVTRATASSVAALYTDTLVWMERLLQQQPFLLGSQPTRADVAMMGPMFRHFFCDPTPARIMRADAPAVLCWVARMWAGADAAARDASAPVAEGQRPPADDIVQGFLPYLVANAAAYGRRARHVDWRHRTVAFRTPVNPYRVLRLDRLQHRYQLLQPQQRASLAGWLGTDADRLLAGARPVRLPQWPQPGLSKPVNRELKGWDA